MLTDDQLQEAVDKSERMAMTCNRVDHAEIIRSYYTLLEKEANKRRKIRPNLCEFISLRKAQVEGFIKYQTEEMNKDTNYDRQE
jgi:hypothetical protein